VATGFVTNPFIYAGFNRRDKEMVKFRNFAKEFAGFFGGGGKGKVKKLVKFFHAAPPVAAVYDCRYLDYCKKTNFSPGARKNGMSKTAKMRHKPPKAAT